MDRLTKIFMHRGDKIHKVDEWQNTLYTYDHRGLVKTEVNAKGDGKVFVYNENGNLISKTDEDGNIVNNGGHMMPGLNRRNKEKPEKPDNPNKAEKPDDQGNEDSSGKDANKAQQGTHIYTYDELNQLVYRKDSQNQTYTYSYDLRGNRIAETGKKESREYIYDETNHLTEGTNWKGDKSAYTYLIKNIELIKKITYLKLAWRIAKRHSILLHLELNVKSILKIHFPGLID